MQDFKNFCKQHGFENYSSLLAKYLKPCIGFDYQETNGKALPIGSSRMGGGPDVPESFSWPLNGYRPLDFLLQINLSDVVRKLGSVSGDVRKTNPGGHANYRMASVMVAALKKRFQRPSASRPRMTEERWIPSDSMLVRIMYIMLNNLQW